MKYLFLLFLLAFSGTAHSQIITTIAGNDSFGFSGDGGPATAAKLSDPGHARPDQFGNIYIADAGNNRIRKVNTTGIISTIAGNGGSPGGDGGPATAAGFSGPTSVIVDVNGYIYICEAGGGHPKVRKIDASGIITTFAGGATGTPGSGDGGPATAAVLQNIADIAFDNDGNLYIADEGKSNIRKVNAAGIISTIAGNGTYGFSGDGGPATAAQLYQPLGVAADDSGNVYIADFVNQRVRKVNAAGIITTIAGTGTTGFNGDGRLASAAELNGPEGVAVDKAGNVYITDPGNRRIRKITAGIITTVAGDSISGHTGDGGPATAAEIMTPSGVAVDSVGNIFITDQGKNDIRRVSHVHNVATQQLTAKSDWVVYPNPATDLLKVSNPLADGAKYEITDMPGRTLLSGSLSAGTQTINVKSLSPGSYIISLYDGNKKDYTQVFIKQ